MKNGYLVKIIPPEGYRVRRFEISRRQALSVAAVLASVFALALSLGVWMLGRAEMRVQQLGTVTDVQQRQLDQFDRRANALGVELDRLRKQDREIRGLMGADRAPQQHPRGTASAQNAAREAPAGPMTYTGASDRLDRLESESQQARSESEGLQRLALRVLNVRKLEELARGRLIAAIPSINPVPRAEVASTFGWRLDPWPSFHAGIDLDADYGTPIRAAAAGQIASVGWDGGYGLKVDIDHGNGYHTWYAHLSRADVQPGAYVRKAQQIAEVGESGDATGPHLHYQVMFEGHAIDPGPFLNGIPSKVLASLK